MVAAASVPVWEASCQAPGWLPCVFAVGVGEAVLDAVAGDGAAAVVFGGGPGGGEHRARGGAKG